ncbi:hypothetical protein MKUB_46890 [Mycobacterium kubicae]|uniref:Uncharacterized protein n=1 Tax=Mycobacterium kubicae TaxID=120959 RepID=A0ABQ1BI14_9MYCO|nr:hypothetical protein MKUB_08270 [Mycobacterium kubicae]GFG67199.1 hypothetical protein MKUB_46890 [Mycobacterium kubicae]
MSAVTMPTAAIVAGRVHVFADPAGIDRHAASITVVIDPAFLAEAGWDAARKVLSFAPEHPLLGRPVCRASGCLTSAPAATRICASCRRRLAEHGLGDDEIASLPPRVANEWGAGRMLVSSTVVDASGNRRVPGCVTPTQNSCAPCRLPMSTSSVLTGKPGRFRRVRRARWPPALASGAIPTVCTVRRTSSGCAPSAHVTHI